MAAMPILLAIVSQGSDTGPLWSSCFKVFYYNFITIYTDILLKKMRVAFAMQEPPAIVSIKNIGVFQILTFEIPTKR